ncbi:Arf-GAP with SH3 domain, ANK repeat and PH domain-containing protein 2 [Liparis tanakae]|uniref:Arf-GAP with SH3 domain, ANK repeat and PH domain-containing protein 2 n=1 Tax=Liparis tanakae TaxID=230148 RepID=A0A4Z2IQR4_9TELE|nr:Arf-GAP with SH3 domain, ANK repeat and PH domain-containing protein 2 [Liparis tanakae]
MLVCNDKSFNRALNRTVSIERPAKEVPGCPPNSKGQAVPAGPTQRKIYPKQRPKRVKAIYNCAADNPDELTFSEGEVIVVDGEEDQEWWVSIAAQVFFFPPSIRAPVDTV